LTTRVPLPPRGPGWQTRFVPEEPVSDDEWAQRARSFGAVAGQYDLARPTYVASLVDDVTAALPGPDAVEVGAGTGKATRLFAARGLQLTCVEPDAGMAAVLRRNCNDLPNVVIVESSLEAWHATRQYDGVIAAQSWHWTAPERRWGIAARLLHEGGVVALFWNHTRWNQVALAPEIDAVYERHGLARQVLNAASKRETTTGWPADEMAALPTFTSVEHRTYYSTQLYTADEWCGYLASTSDHLVAEPQVNEAVLAEIHHIIERNGDALEIPRRCDLYLARRNAVAA
jgi:SAM-dependent methyltransferase